MAVTIWLGDVGFHEVAKMLGYKLTESDKAMWNKYYNPNADLSGMEHCFHVFDMPRCIRFRGDEAMDAIKQMFTPDKIIPNAGIGQFPVYRQQ